MISSSWMSCLLLHPEEHNERSHQQNTLPFRPWIHGLGLGVRYMKLEAALTISPGSVIPGGTRSTSDSWADSIVGGLATVSVAENVDLIAYVDLGGGSSDFTWQTMLGVNWQFADRWTA